MTVAQDGAQKLISQVEWVSSSNEISTAVTSESDIPGAAIGSGAGTTLIGSRGLVLRVTPQVRDRLLRAIGHMRELAGLGAGWDSYGAHTVQSDVVLQAVRLLAAIFDIRDDIPDPLIVPTSEGGIQLEWDRDGLHLEFEVHPSLAIDVYWERPDGETWDGPLQDNQSTLVRFLQRLG